MLLSRVAPPSTFSALPPRIGDRPLIKKWLTTFVRPVATYLVSFKLLTATAPSTALGHPNNVAFVTRKITSLHMTQSFARTNYLGTLFSTLPPLWSHILIPLGLLVLGPQTLLTFHRHHPPTSNLYPQTLQVSSLSRPPISSQQLFRWVTSLLRAFCLATLFLPSIITRLVPPMASRWRVMTIIAPLPKNSLRPLRTIPLPLALSVPAVLLKNRQLGPWQTVCVTRTCRPRFRSNFRFAPFTPAPHPKGKDLTNLCTPVTLMVHSRCLPLTTSLLGVTPPVTALLNTNFLRTIIL